MLLQLGEGEGRGKTDSALAPRVVQFRGDESALLRESLPRVEDGAPAIAEEEAAGLALPPQRDAVGEGKGEEETDVVQVIVLEYGVLLERCGVLACRSTCA
jgi:hypothetical protein